MVKENIETRIFGEGSVAKEKLVPKIGPEEAAYCNSHGRAMETCGSYFNGFTGQHYRIIRCPKGKEEAFQEVATYRQDGYVGSGSPNK